MRSAVCDRFAALRPLLAVIGSLIVAAIVTGFSVPAAQAASGPTVPTALVATPDDGRVALSWSAPDNNGGAAISDYRIQYKRTTTTAWTTFADEISSATAATVTGLSNGSAYNLRVAALNDVGVGAYATAVAATPRTVSGAPTALKATGKAESVVLSWSAPAANGGVAVTDYRIEYADDLAGAWMPFTDAVSPATSATVTGLGNGTSYSFRVAAINAAGIGPISAVATAVPRAVPGQIAAVTLVPGNARIAVQWDEPAQNGGVPVTDYRVQYKLTSATTWSTANDGVSTATSATVTGLSNGSGYDVRIAAINVAGVGVFSALASGTPRTVPAAPSIVAVSAGDGQATVTWSAPANAGGSAITDYRLEYKLTSDSIWTMVDDDVSTATTATIIGLVNGRTYNTRISALNDAGLGKPSASASATPRTLPAAVTDVIAKPGNARVVLAWSTPANTGGSVITDYRVQYRLDTESGWTTFTDTISRSTTTTVTGLVNGTSYAFQVSAITAVGAGPASPTTSAVPATVTSAPAALAAVAGSGQVALTWTVPTSTGGAAVSDYLVQFKLSTATTWTTSTDAVSAETSATVTGLINANRYSFRVAAVNSAGNSSFSGSVAAMPRGAPAEVADLSAVPGDGSATLSWTAPNATGGSAITGYQVTYRADGDASASTTSGPATTTTVSGLTNGLAYTFTVAAISALGTGGVSTAVTTTPRTTPGAPGPLLLTAESTRLVLTWSPPSATGGAEINDHVVQYRSAGTTAWTMFPHDVSALTSATISGLINGSTYDVRVAAVNVAGPGTYTLATALVRTAPDAPTALAVTAGDAGADLTWTAPADAGGAAISDYVVQFRGLGESPGEWTSVTDGMSTATNATVPALINGLPYAFRIAAVNTAGAGDFSAVATATPRGRPGAPSQVLATAGNTTAHLTWSPPSSTGGSEITDYTVQYKGSGTETWLTLEDGLSTSTVATITGLTNGTAYDVRVGTVNGIGSSDFSASTAVTPATVAGAPTQLRTTFYRRAVLVQWSAPDNDGGAPVTDFTVQVRRSDESAWTTFVHPASAQTSADVTGLSGGIDYDVRVASVNNVGSSDFSATVTGTVLDSASAPTDTKIALSPSRPSSIVASWSAPQETGGGLLLGYYVRVHDESGNDLWSQLVAPTETGVTLDGLQPGVQLTVVIAAYTTAGLGDAASGTVTIPAGVIPQPPTDVTPLAGASSPVDTVTVSGWVASATGDTAQLMVTATRPNGTVANSCVSERVPNGTRASCDLKLFSSGEFQIQAKTYDGWYASVWTPARTLRVDLPPRAPQYTIAYPYSQGSALVYWEVSPRSNTQAPVTEWLVTASPGGRTWTFPAAADHGVLPGLTLDETYTFTVAGLNHETAGAPSPPSRTVTIEADLPGPPLDVRATGTARTGAVSWQPPTPRDFAAPVTGYQVTKLSYSREPNETVTLGPDARTYEFTELKLGNRYRFTVATISKRGVGPAAQSPDLGASDRPDAPTGVKVLPDDGAANVSWTAAVDNGAWISKYTVTATPGGSTVEVRGTTSARLAGLSNGTAYTFTVVATNVVGDSDASVPSAAATPTSESLDTDADGLPDILELRAGADLLLPDSDGDGLTDAQEVLQLNGFTSPTAADSDGNGVSDGAEDADGDSLDNATELQDHLNPLAADTDGDTLSDAIEGQDERSDPTKSDTDDDGVDDGIEVEAGLDPRSSDSSSDGVSDAQRTITRVVGHGQARAQVRTEASLQRDVGVDVGGTPDISGVVSATVSVHDHGTTAEPAKVTYLDIPVATAVATERLSRLKPFRWDIDRNTWVLVDNDVSVSTADRTLRVQSPELGVRYAVVDLDVWRSHLQGCANAANGKPSIDLEVVLDATWNIIDQDPTGERFRAADTVLSSLRVGDEAALRSFSLPWTSTGFGGSYTAEPFQFDAHQDDAGPSVTTARRELAAAAAGAGGAGSADLPPVSEHDRQQLAGALFPDATGSTFFPEQNLNDPCRVHALLLITDGRTPLTVPGTVADRPVHVLDVGNDGHSQWLEDLAARTHGSYSYVPDATDISHWIDQITPPPPPPAAPDYTTDTDGDGLSDWVETHGVYGYGILTLYSDPTKVDTDGDGLTDSEELGTPYTVAELGQWDTDEPISVYHAVSDPAQVDSDHDAVTDVEELEFSLNAFDADEDVDGLNDSDEIQWGTDPTLADTDSDQYPDGFEIQYIDAGYDPVEHNVQVEKTSWLADFSLGMFCGDNHVCHRDTIPWLVGNVTSGFLIFGDVRDFIASAVEGRKMNATFIAVTAIPFYGDSLKVASVAVPMLRRLNGSARASVRALLRNSDGITQIVARYEAEFTDLVPLLRARKVTEQGIAFILIHNDPVLLERTLKAADESLRYLPDNVPVKQWDEFIPAYHLDGASGEAQLKKLVGADPEQKQICTKLVWLPKSPCRYIDVRVERINPLTEEAELFAKESKVGRAWRSKETVKQVIQDAGMVARKRVAGVEWHFFASAKSHLIGPSQAVLDALVANNIPFYIHLPTT